MTVDDMWYLKKLGPDKKRVPSKLHGKGKRWRVRYDGGTRYFERQTDAKNFDAAKRTGLELDLPRRSAGRSITFHEYADRWCQSRTVTWAVETRRRVPGNLRLHLIPEFGDKPLTDITTTLVLEWISRRLADDTPKSSLKLYFELLDAVLAAAVADKEASENPCDGVKLGQILRGVSRAPKWVPSQDDVVALFHVVPARYHAVLWLGAGQGLRISEALGMEDSERCIESAHQELHVVQQLRYSPKEYGGFYLSEPKSGSSGTIDLDPVVDKAISDHAREFPPDEVEVTDITGPEPQTRAARLLFTTTRGNPFTASTWSKEWIKWRTNAGWPDDPHHSGFHALRHFFATTLISNGADPKDVQRALRHKTLQITLETYVHWWPRRERRRGVVGALLQAATERPAGRQP
jgi:integrase